MFLLIPINSPDSRSLELKVYKPTLMFKYASLTQREIKWSNVFGWFYLKS